MSYDHHAPADHLSSDNHSSSGNDARPDHDGGADDDARPDNNEEIAAVAAALLIREAAVPAGSDHVACGEFTVSVVVLEQERLRR